MKATVITTGPGVIMATATASMELAFGEPVEAVHHAAVQEGHDGEPAAEDESSSLREVPADPRSPDRCSETWSDGAAEAEAAQAEEIPEQVAKRARLRGWRCCGGGVHGGCGLVFWWRDANNQYVIRPSSQTQPRRAMLARSRFPFKNVLTAA